MNDHGAHDLEESRTRRSVLATAGGLLLPAGLLAGIDVEGGQANTKAKRRRRRHRPGGMFTADVVINFRNATSETLSFYMGRPFTREIYIPIAPGKESGFAAGVDPWKLGVECYLNIRLPNQDDVSYSVRCVNFEFVQAFSCISWYRRGPWHSPDDISENRYMKENDIFEITHRGYRFQVHRWSNGEEPLDDYDETYTRFFVTMSEA